MATESKYTSLLSKLIWFIIPLLIGFFTWIVITIYSLTTSVSVMSKEDQVVEQQRIDIQANQKEILKVARESRTFSMQNNDILTHKADREDLNMIEKRLEKIEIKVDKIYSRGSFTEDKKKIIPMIDYVSWNQYQDTLPFQKIFESYDQSKIIFNNE